MPDSLNLQLAVFEEFSPINMALLSDEMKVQNVPRGHVFVREGEDGNSFYVILEGRVSVTRCPQNSREPQYITTLNSGDLFGLVALVDRGPRSATCSAATNCKVASLSVESFSRLCAKSADFAQQMEFIIAKQLARDIRVYNQALHQAIQGSTLLNTTVMMASSEYRGPERRTTDRRRVERRRAYTPA